VQFLRSQKAKECGGLCQARLHWPEVHLRGYAATVDILRLRVSSLGLPSEARPKGERRMVDQTGIEPVTS
jgi:hypothetical protein